jgi:hypothetical protein
MAQDRYNRTITAGSRVVFSERDAGRNRNGMGYGDVTEIDGNNVCIDGEIWIPANCVELH